MGTFLYEDGGWTPEATQSNEPAELTEQERKDEYLSKLEFEESVYNSTTGPDTYLSEHELYLDAWLTEAQRRSDPKFAPDGELLPFKMEQHRAGYMQIRDHLNQFRQMAPNQMASVQELLVLAGMIDLDDVDFFGQINGNLADVKAWGVALRESALAGVGVLDWLESRISARGGREAILNSLSGDGGGGGGGGGAKAPTIRLMAEDDANALADAVGQQLFGRNPTKEERKLAVEALWELQRTEQKAMFAQLQAGGGEVKEPTDPTVALEDTLRDEAPIEARAHDIATQFQALTRLLGGGGLGGSA